MDLRGKAVLVSGGARRLGRAIALAVANRGANVAVHFHSSEEAAIATEAEIRDGGSRAMRVGADAADSAEVGDMLQQVEAELGPLDAWVAAAGVFRRTPPNQVTDDDWQFMMRGNFETFRVPASLIGPAMVQRGAGSIVAIADVAAVRPWADYVPYCVSKSRLLHHARKLARELAPRVRVNTILPGPVLFPDDYPEEAKQREIGNTLLRREGSADDIAKAALFLLENDYLTGVQLPVDGGRLLA